MPMSHTGNNHSALGELIGTFVELSRHICGIITVHLQNYQYAIEQQITKIYVLVSDGVHNDK